MLKIDQINPFAAYWNFNNRLLDPNFNSNRGEFLKNTIRKVIKFIFYIPNCIVATCINPRSESQFYSSSTVVTNYRSFTKKIITPDQVHLIAKINILDGATSDTPTVLLFNPLGAHDSIHYKLKEI